LIVVDASKIGEEKIMESALEAGAEDVAGSEGAWEITTEPAEFLKVKDALAAAGIEPLSAEVTMIPQNSVDCDAAMAAKVLKLVDAVEDNDDVQKVFHNADIAEDVMASLG
jgi:transcriptional/translational regulatory protein YebC/TACO1